MPRKRVCRMSPGRGAKPAGQHRPLSPRRAALPHLLTALLLPGLLGGCGLVVLDPAGDVAIQERNLIVQSTVLMLLIVVPVICMALYFARHYREGNKEAVYDPDWHHSTQLEVAIWSAPLAIIIALGAITWLSTHTLDPFRPLSRVDSAHPVQPGTRALEVQAVSLDWKWLFIYPDYNIATVNDLAAPVDMPIHFRITSASVFNTFFVPALAGQIYSMAGMETQLNAVINREGDYEGRSAHYSGSGFSRMSFTFHGLSHEGFNSWVQKAKSGGSALDRATYLQLEKPSEEVPPTFYSRVENGLFNAIVNLCVDPGSLCVSEANHIDAHGGAGPHSHGNVERLQYDNRRLKEGVEPPAATFPASGRPPQGPVQPQGMNPNNFPSDPVNRQRTTPDTDGGHAMPGAPNQSPAPPQLNTSH